MMVKYMFLLILCFALIAVGRVSTELEGNEISKPGLDKKSHSPLDNNSNLNEKTGGLKSVVDSNKVDQVKEEKDQVGGSKEVVENNKANEKSSSEQKQVGSKEDQVGKKDKDGSVGKGEKKEKVSEEGSDSKDGTKEKPMMKKEGSHGEECDASNSCKDEKNNLVACLRVPGNESPDLSLLIQNKGNGPLSVTISAPDFVQLEKTKVQLQEKEDSKIKVSIKKEGTDSLISLTTGDGHCSIDFRDLISPNLRKETDHSANSRHIIAIPLMVLGLLVVAASAWLCVRFVRMYGPTYQKLAMELPVVGGGSKEESDFNDGWNSNWDDNWDDEEAPKTPSMPVTPSLSSKGLASRRFNKEGWKD